MDIHPAHPFALRAALFSKQEAAKSFTDRCYFCFRALLLVVLAAAPTTFIFLSPKHNHGHAELANRLFRQVDSPEPPTTKARSQNIDPKALEARRLTSAAGTLRADWKEDSIRKAIGKYGEAIELWIALGRSAEAANVMEALAETHFSLSDYKDARENYLKAARTFPASDRQSRLRAANRAAHVNVYLGKSRETLVQATRLLNYYQQSKAVAANDEAEVNNTAGEASYSLGRLRQSIGFFNRALELWKLNENKRGVSLAHVNLGYVYSDLGELAKAREHFATALTSSREIGDRRHEALALTAHGTIHSFLGEKQAALDHHTQAMNLFRMIGDRAGEAVTLNSIGSAYEELNQPQVAVDNYERALASYQQIGNRDFEAVTRYYLGGAIKALGEKQKALEHFQQSLALSRQLGQPRIAAYALSAISSLQTSDGRYLEALRWLNQALGVYRAIGDRRGQANALLEIALTYRSLGRTKDARKYCKQALPFAMAAGDRHVEATILYQLALLARDLGLLEEALKYVKQSIETIETLRLQIVSPELRASYFASVHKHSELYINLLMKLNTQQPEKGFAATAFEMSERARARALLEIISEAGANIRQGINADLQARERFLQEQLSAKAAYRMRLLDAGDKNELEVAETEIRALTTAYHELQTQIKQQSPRYAALVQPQPLTLEEIRSELIDRDTVLLEYSLGDHASYAWAVTAGSIASFELPARDKIESTALDVYKLLTARQALAATGSTDYQQNVALADKEYWTKAALLSEMVLKPVAHMIRGKRLLLVADGALQYVPFDALPAVDAVLDHEHQTVEDKIPPLLGTEIATLPSASTLAVIRQGQRNSRAEKLVFVLADPVFESDDPRIVSSENATTAAEGIQYRTIREVVAPGDNGIPRLLATRQEAEAIMVVTPDGAGRTAMDFDAGSAIAKSGELGRFRIVHFATHSLTDTDHPELSGILLSRFNQQGKSEDGYLQLHDIYNLDLSETQLVVLSACRTALGKNVKGEGIVGLTRGFMYAGSKSVIASLWKVDDRATAELMKHFYHGLFAEGLTPAAALRKAKEAMWRQPRWRAPYFWAAFVLQGEYNDAIPVPRANHVRSKTLIAVVIVLIIAGAVYAIKRKRLKAG